MSLTFKELRKTSLERCKRWHGEAGVNDWSLSDWAVATTGELGEACNVIKKLNRAAHGLVGNQDAEVPELQQMLAKEIADTMIYLDLLAARAGVNLEAAVIAKFNEVSIRNNFPERL